MARGGKNYPKKPAAVSGPGATSSRTDGGAGSSSQPLRTPTGGDYGEAKGLEDQQRGAPLAAVTGGVPATSGPTGGPPALGPPTGDVFGPTTRPGESGVSGAGQPGQIIAQDVDAFLRVLYAKFPHPGIAMLMRKDI